MSTRCRGAPNPPAPPLDQPNTPPTPPHCDILSAARSAFSQNYFPNFLGKIHNSPPSAAPPSPISRNIARNTERTIVCAQTRPSPAPHHAPVPFPCARHQLTFSTRRRNVFPLPRPANALLTSHHPAGRAALAPAWQTSSRSRRVRCAFPRCGPCAPEPYLSHLFNPSTSPSISCRFFSNSPNIPTIPIPSTIPATIHGQFEPTVTAA
jgi:hypothetical protein